VRSLSPRAKVPIRRQVGLREGRHVDYAICTPGYGSRGRLHLTAMKHWLGMASSLRNVIALVLVFFSALVIETAFRHQWIGLFVTDDPYFLSERGTWLSPRWLAMTWGYDLLVSTIAGIGLALLLAPRAGKWWYIYLGAAIGGVHFVAHLLFIAKHPDIDVNLEPMQSVWINGGYFVPVCGICIGGAITNLFNRWLSTPL
jgi:hypothetical protein